VTTAGGPLGATVFFVAHQGLNTFASHETVYAILATTFAEVFEVISNLAIAIHTATLQPGLPDQI